VWLDGVTVARYGHLPDRELGFIRKPFLDWTGVHEPGAKPVRYRTDENGFRNPPGIKQADIAFIGDSFTEAATVDERDTFVRRVGAGTGLNVVCLGRSWAGAEVEFLILKRYGLKYRPRYVVWTLTESTDLNDAVNFDDWKRHPTGTQPFL